MYVVKKTAQKVLREPESVNLSLNNGGGLCKDHKETVGLYQLKNDTINYQFDFKLYWSEAGDGYCQITGRYTDTITVHVQDLNGKELLRFQAGKRRIWRYFGYDRIKNGTIEIDINEFIYLMNKLKF